MFCCVRISAERSPFESCLFLLIWYYRIARILWGRGHMDLVCVDVNCFVLFCFLRGCVYFFLPSCELTNRKTQTFDCAKKKKLIKALPQTLGKSSVKLGLKWDEYVYLIAPGSLIRHKCGTLSCSVLHQRF